jgi:Pyridine nucleotide-disulphide oxidoreductase
MVVASVVDGGSLVRQEVRTSPAAEQTCQHSQSMTTWEAVVTSDADVIVVGLGVGGDFVAGRLAEAGLEVVGIESTLVGGECPYWGCVPSKMIIRAANALAEARRVGKLAGHATVQPDWSVVARRIREEATDNWNDTAALTVAGGGAIGVELATPGAAGDREVRPSAASALTTVRPGIPLTPVQ